MNQAFELADNLDGAHRCSSCMGSLVPDQSLSMMTSDSTAKNSGGAAYTRRSSSTVVEAVSCFFCGLDTHRNRSLAEFLSARPLPTTLLGTASANGSNKAFGEQPFNCCCTLTTTASTHRTLTPSRKLTGWAATTWEM